MNRELEKALMRSVGIVSVLLIVLAWLALDDITTDNATGGFVPEYSVLEMCGAWFTAVAAWLFFRRRRLTGVTSLLAVGVAVLAFWSLPHHYAPASPVNYLGLLSIAWFLGLAIWLIRARFVHPPSRNL